MVWSIDSVQAQSERFKQELRCTVGDKNKLEAEVESLRSASVDQERCTEKQVMKLESLLGQARNEAEQAQLALQSSSQASLEHERTICGLKQEIERANNRRAPLPVSP